MVKPTSRLPKFIIVGLTLVLFNFAVYTFLAHFILKNNDLLWLASIISYFLATFLGYFLHSRITWKDRNVTRRSIALFFIWNFLTAFVISPFFTWLFGFFTPLYQFAHTISSNLHLPFTYDFVESTGIFCCTSLVTTILNYFFYDKFVFHFPSHTPSDRSPTTIQTSAKTRVQTSTSTKTQAKTSPTSASSSPKVSIIVPIYNTAQYLRPCLRSITHQTYSHLEILLIDDGSTDNSLDLARQFAQQDRRIKVFHQDNHGQSTARNLGLQHATGTYISFIDSDDTVAPDFIAQLLQPYLENPDLVLTFCGINRQFLSTGKTESLYLSPLPAQSHASDSVYVLKLLARDGRLYSCFNKLYRAKIARQLSFDPRLNFAEDTKFVLTYLQAAHSAAFAYIPEPLYNYNFGAATSTINSSSLDWQNWQTSYRYLQSWVGKHPSLQEKFWLRLILLRWRISHRRSVFRARQSRS